MGSVKLTLDDLERQIDTDIDEIAELLTHVGALPALGKTGDGYPEMAALLTREMKATGMEVEPVDVPTDYLLEQWGSEFERTSDYIAVARHVPRTIVFGRHPGIKAGAPSLHLTQHYDLPARLATELAAEGAEREGDRVTGPGVSFCRAGIISMLLAARALTRLELAGDLFLSFTPDNHLGGETGAGYLVHRALGKSPYVITGSEGGPDLVGLGYKGALWLKITTRGKTATAAIPSQGVNAIDKMAIVQAALSDLARRLETHTSRWPILPTEAGSATLIVSQIRSSGWGVPNECVAFIDRRILPDETLSAALEEVRDVLRGLEATDPDMQVEMQVIHAVEPAGTDPSGPLASSLRRSIGEVLRVKARDAVFSYYTDFRLFGAGWGAETVNYSPGRVDRPDNAREFVVLRDVTDAAKVLVRTATEFLA
jgi:succinyl-diaminopimelate desuccinylase